MKVTPQSDEDCQHPFPCSSSNMLQATANQQPRGLTIVESLTTLVVCFLLLLIVSPLALINLGYLNPEESATNGKTTGLAELDGNQKKGLSTPRLYKPSLIEGENHPAMPTAFPERTPLKSVPPEHLPIAPIIPQPKKP